MLKNWHLVFCPTCQQLNWHWNIVLQCWLCSKCWCVIVWKISHDYLALYSRHFTIFTYQPQFLSHYFVYIFLFSIMSFLPSQFLCGSGYHYLPWVKQLASSPLIFFFLKASSSSVLSTMNTQAHVWPLTVSEIRILVIHILPIQAPSSTLVLITFISLSFILKWIILTWKPKVVSCFFWLFCCCLA